MKKFFSIMAVAAVAIGLAACGGDSKEDKATKEGVAVMEQVQKAYKEAKAAAEAAGFLFQL